MDLLDLGALASLLSPVGPAMWEEPQVVEGQVDLMVGPLEDQEVLGHLMAVMNQQTVAMGEGACSPSL